MKSRIISTLFLWLALLLSLSFFKANAAVGWIVLASVLTQREINRLLRGMRYPVQSIPTLLVAFVFPLGAWLVKGSWEIALDLTAGALLFLSITSLFQRFIETTLSALVGTLFAFLYVPFNLHFFVILLKSIAIKQGEHEALACFVWLIAVIKFTDVGGLLSGLFCGKHRFAPSISPKKTWEGVIGGVLIALLIGGSLAWGFRTYLPPGFCISKAFIFAFLLAWTAIISDLLESSLKRLASVKDSGRLIPGIGGVLDLTDSLLLTAPAAYLLFKYFV